MSATPMAASSLLDTDDRKAAKKVKSEYSKSEALSKLNHGE